jgi:N-acetylmuramic acid 6-phosphate (MurNAc-6-P) etherase
MIKPPGILELLQEKPSPQSLDFVHHKTQFHLHHLVTEQRHPLSWNLSFILKRDIRAGLAQLQAVDRDISQRLSQLARDEIFLANLDQAAESIRAVIGQGGQIFIYGCGSTGRLAKQMESALWRPFWRRAQKFFSSHRKFSRGRQKVPPPQVESKLIGEMTGGDRALISALEGFEDLELVGRLQVRERNIQPGDVVICITEGGETSSVIGAMKEAWETWEKVSLAAEKRVEQARRYLYFIYNNPDKVLLPLERSRSIIQNPAITRINLTTGPQAITGSTRMQATTIETFLVGGLLEAGLRRYLIENGGRRAKELLADERSWSLAYFLQSFEPLRKNLEAALGEAARLVELESRVYRQGGQTIYFARQALVTVFVDCAERSPTFHLPPLDPRGATPRRSWFQVWTEASSSEEAWRVLLGRDFRGLDSAFYERPFKEGITDDFLRQAALTSLAQAGTAEKDKYDFSFAAENVSSRGPQAGDLGIVVCLSEEVTQLEDRDSSWRQFIELCRRQGARLGLILVLKPWQRDEFSPRKLAVKLGLDLRQEVIVPLVVDTFPDLLGLREHILLKMFLNAHSTAVMAWLGRVVGNTMTYVNPSNLKLIGRATYLIQSHVNDILQAEEWVARYGRLPLLTYAQANALLWAAMEYVRSRQEEISEVALVIVRVLEAWKRQGMVSWKEAQTILEAEGLENYLLRHKPSLGELSASYIKEKNGHPGEDVSQDFPEGLSRKPLEMVKKGGQKRRDLDQRKMQERRPLKGMKKKAK